MLLEDLFLHTFKMLVFVTGAYLHYLRFGQVQNAPYTCNLISLDE
jgi:hypothetical protein